MTPSEASTIKLYYNRDTFTVLYDQAQFEYALSLAEDVLVWRIEIPDYD